MSYATANVKLVQSAGRMKTFVYDTTDDIGDVDASGYFTDGVSVHAMAVGDIVWVRDWTSAVPTMTVAGRNAASLASFTLSYVSGISTNAATITAYPIGS